MNFPSLLSKLSINLFNFNRIKQKKYEISRDFMKVSEVSLKLMKLHAITWHTTSISFDFDVFH